MPLKNQNAIKQVQKIVDKITEKVDKELCDGGFYDNLSAFGTARVLIKDDGNIVCISQGEVCH